jgi:uncharacterized protein with NAD-binding domain and iron-sulfur cluster
MERACRGAPGSATVTRADGTADVVVAGGGIAGLSCAAALAGCGLRVAVLEQDSRLGGRAASWIDHESAEAVDIGPHVITSEHRNFLALLDRLGTSAQVHWQSEPLITLLDGGRKLRMRAPAWPPPLHGAPNLKNVLRCVSWRDVMSNLRVAWAAARLTEAGTLELDDIDAHSYLLRQGVSPRFIEWFWRSSMLAVLNVPLRECSAAAMMRVFRLLLGRSGYCFGFPKVALADLYVPGCRRAIEAAGGCIRTSTSVRSVRMAARGEFDGFLLEDGSVLRAAAGVLALPPQALAEVGKASGSPFEPRVIASAGRFKPCRYLSTMLWFDRKLTNEAFWARVCADGDLNTDFYDLSNIRPDRPDASLVVANAIHVEEAWHWSDERVVAKTLREVAQFAPAASAASLRHSRVHRIPMAVACPAPATERSRPGAATSTPGLWLAGDWTATGLPCSMESAARSGAIAAECVADALGHALRIAQPPPDTQWPVSLFKTR